MVKRFYIYRDGLLLGKDGTYVADVDRAITVTPFLANLYKHDEKTTLIEVGENIPKLRNIGLDPFLDEFFQNNFLLRCPVCHLYAACERENDEPPNMAMLETCCPDCVSMDEMTMIYYDRGGNIIRRFLC